MTAESRTPQPLTVETFRAEVRATLAGLIAETAKDGDKKWATDLTGALEQLEARWRRDEEATS